MEEFSCCVCNKTFSRKYNRDRHEKKFHEIGKEEHSSEEHLKCPECGMKFSRRDNLCRHVKQKHPYSKTYTVISDSRDIYSNNIYNINVNVNVPKTEKKRDIGGESVPEVSSLNLEHDHKKFLGRLSQIHGNDESVYRYLKNIIRGQIRSEVKLFGEIYMAGDDPSTWSIKCINPKTCHFMYKNVDGEWVHDPHASQSRRLFYSNYTDSVLFLMDKVVFQPLNSNHVGSDFDVRAYEIMDANDMGNVINRICKICSSEFQQELFGRELVRYYQERLRIIKDKALHTSKNDP